MGAEAWLVTGAGARLTSEPASVLTENTVGSDLTADTVFTLTSEGAASPGFICVITTHCLFMQAFFSLPGPPYLFWSRQLRHWRQSWVLSLLRQPVQFPHRARFLFLASESMMEDTGVWAPACPGWLGVTAWGCCCWRTIWPPTMFVLNTDWGVEVSAATSFSSSLIFFLAFLVLGERSWEGEWTWGCCVVMSCWWGRGVVVTGAMVIRGGAWLMLTPASVPATSQSH